MSLLYRQDPNDKRGKWSDVFKALSLILLVYFSFRWALWEPFVIPSGSMEQTLLVQDYVVVKKFAYGLRVPFSDSWLFGPEVPKRGDIVVFKSKEQNDHFLVKRVVGLPGDEIRMDAKGFLQVNETPFVYQQIEEDDEYFDVFTEDNGRIRYEVRMTQGREQSAFEFKVPEGHLYMMGDNRNFSSDSRFWGPLPLNKIMGKLTMIWMSCEESDTYSSFLCAPKDFRKNRFFKVIE